MKKLLTILICLFAQASFAGDASYLTSLGFSDDGKYYAYMEEGVQDGSGFYWVELGIINVKTNKYIAKDWVDQEKLFGPGVIDLEISEAQEKEMLNHLKHRLGYSNYGFSKQPKEEVIISRDRKDLSIYKNSVFSLMYWAQGGASTTVPTYELHLKEVAAPGNHEDYCYADPQMIDLTMTFEGGWDQPAANYTLQKDSRLPKSRYCAFDYSITHVFHSQGSLAVVVSYRQPGFEGPNERYMVITTKL